MEHKMNTAAETKRNWPAPGSPIHQSAGRHRCGQLKWLAFLALVLAAMAILPRPAAAMDATLNVADGNPNFTADQINPGQSTTAEFVATPYAGSPNGQGHPAPTIRSESFSVTVDKYTTIGEISGLPEGAVVKHSRPITDPSSGDTTETFSISGKVPSSVFNISIGLTCSKSTPTGTSHPVTLKPVSIATKQAAGTCGRAATENYKVEQFAVNVQGPPYVIVDNGDSRPYSQYTVTTSGEPGPFSYQWTKGASVDLESGESNTSSSGHVDVYGDPNAGGDAASLPGLASQVTCLVRAGNGVSQTGVCHVYVIDELVDVVNTRKVQQAGQPLVAGSMLTCTVPGQMVTLGHGTTFSVFYTAGLEISGSAEVDDFVKAAIGANFSTTRTWSSPSNVSIGTPGIVNQSYQLRVAPVEEVQAGTALTFAPTGITGTTPWTNPELNNAEIAVVLVANPSP